MATSRLGLLVCERDEIVADWPVRELGGDGLELRVGLEVDARCLNGGGEPGTSVGELMGPLLREPGSVAAVIVGLRLLELRRGSEPSKSEGLREGELREEGDRAFSP